MKAVTTRKAMTSTKLFEAIESANPRLKPSRKIDAAEEILGELTPELKRLWSAFETQRLIFQDLCDRFDDRFELFKHDMAEFGETIPDRIVEEHQSVMLSEISKLRSPGAVVATLSGLLQSLLLLDFQPPKGRRVIVIREGFKAACRESDLHNDWKSPFQDVYEKITVYSQVIPALIAVFSTMLSGKSQQPDEDAGD